MAESDAAVMERLRKELGEKVEIPVPEGMIPVHNNMTGVLSKIAAALARAEISIFAISTYDTDYVLVPSADAEKARSALTASGTCRFADA